MNIFRFLDWKMYQDAKKLNQKTWNLVESLETSIKYKYGNQMNRASLSICLNIAEGAGRNTDLDRCRFFDMSLGSLSELIACVDNLIDENKINKVLFDEFYEQALSISKQIQGMQHKLKTSPMIKR